MYRKMYKNSQVERVNVINMYLTPLAIILVGMAIVYSEPIGWPLYGSLLLLGISLINNFIIAVFAKKSYFMRILRMILNVIINVLLVYYLVGYWGPIWYLFLLTPIATAVYSSRLKTFITSIIMCGLLAGIYAVRGVSSPMAWGQVFSKMLLLLFLSLFVNALVYKCYRMR